MRKLTDLNIDADITLFGMKMKIEDIEFTLDGQNVPKILVVNGDLGEMYLNNIKDLINQYKQSLDKIKSIEKLLSELKL